MRKHAAHSTPATPKATTTLITLQQASDIYGPPYTSLRDLVLRGHLPSVKLGDTRRIWVRRADVERLIEQGTERRDGEFMESAAL